MTAAVFLDRDNTIIHNDGDLGDPDQVELIQGAASAIASLRGLGYRIFVVTNQAGVARGKYTEDDVQAVHERISELIEKSANGARIDAFYYCPFHPESKTKAYRDANHPDRKPNPGMLLRAADEHNVDLGQSWMVGDQVRDVQAGAKAGTRTILLRADAAQLRTVDASTLAGVTQDVPGDDPNQQAAISGPSFFASTLVEAARIIAQQRKPDGGETGRHPQTGPRRWDAAAVAQLQRPRPTSDKTQSDSSDSPDPSNTTPGNPQGQAAAGRKPTSPFRPWNAPPPRDQPEQNTTAKPTDEPSKAKPQSTGKKAEKPGNDQATPHHTPHASATRPIAEPSEASADKPTVSADEPPAYQMLPTAEAPESAEPDERAKLNDRDEPDASSTAPQPAATPVKPAEPEADADAASTPAHEPASEPARHSQAWSSEKTLRQILAELRTQRGTTGHFGSSTIFAIILQSIAVVCLIGGLWMGQSDDSLFQRWLLSGLLIQGATIAVLLWRR